MRFAADAMLGRLAKWLRLLGHDVFYERDIEDGALIRLARSEGRVILTRDAGLVRPLHPGEYLLIRHNRLAEQLAQVLGELRLAVRRREMLTRCVVCNAPLVSFGHEEARGLVPDYVHEHAGGFTRCPSCGRVYWEGTHRARMERLIEAAGIVLEE